MNRNSTGTNPIEKGRIRDEINAQIHEFLQRGGKIDVLVANQRQQTSSTAIGSVWRVDDLAELDR
ncbi:hypothetical protein [Haliea sp. E17]|uniref:hypothetical protein n=1 Tax=Haliea sp. E17 TaxID=3401576 RepID=UPI003AACFB67